MANGQVTIADLPTDILILIFKIYSMIEWEGGDVPWTKITHVCRPWRHIALSAAALWSYIRIAPTTTLERVHTWIERSQQAPLTVVSLFSLNVTNNPQEADIVQVVLGQLSRIQELQLYLTDASVLGSAVASAYPRLRRLAVHAKLDAVHETPFSLLPHLDTAFPNLESFTLRNFRFDVDLGRFPACLTSLTLFEGIPSTHATVAQVLEMLRRLPLLEELTIGKSKLREDLPPSTPSPSSLPSITLPRLRYLSISEGIRPCVDLLTHLAVPKGLQYNLDIQATHGTDSTEATAAAVWTWIQQVSEPWRAVCFELEPELDDELEEDNTTTLTFTSSTVEDPRSVLSPSPSSSSPSSQTSKIIIELPHTPPHTPSPTTLFTTFDYSHVKTLALKPHEYPLTPLVPILDRLSAVETLLVVGDGMTEVEQLGGLLSFQRHHSHLPLFPELKTLYLTGLRIDEELVKQLHRAFGSTSTLQRLVLGRDLAVGFANDAEWAEEGEEGETVVEWAEEEEMEMMYGRTAGRSVDELAVREAVWRAGVLEESGSESEGDGESGSGSESESDG